jgi:hypothetical protein
MTELVYIIWSASAVVLALTVGGWVALLRCPHRNASRPYHGIQRCMDCAAWRMYEIGGPIGRWMR